MWLPAGSYSTAFDLSTRNVATGETVSMTTANCYVADRPGKYRLPLVYGNGVKDGSPNPDAYSQSLTSASGFLTTFLDHKDNPITSPYIATQHSGKTLTPVIIWADAPGLVTDLSITGSGTNAYLNFTVPAENITQGNALVGVTIDGEIAWSWHIWVTEEDLKVSDKIAQYRTPSGIVFSTEHVGWTDAFTRIYAERTCSLRVVQPASGQESAPVLVTQAQAEYNCPSTNTFYQWGRKDPILGAGELGPGPGVFHKNRTVYDMSDPAYEPRYDVIEQAGVGKSIQQPYIYYFATENINCWQNPRYYNVWNANLTPAGIGNRNIEVKKTIYDPSPVGYKIPTPAAWDDFSSTTFYTVGTYRQEGYGYVYQSGDAYVFFKGTGIRDAYARPLPIMNMVNGSVYMWSAVPVSTHGNVCLGRTTGDSFSINNMYSCFGYTIRPIWEETAVSYTYHLSAMPPANLQAGGGTSSNGFVTSYRTNDNTGDTEGVAWSVAGYYSDAACTTPYNGSNASTRPAWLTSITGGGSGSAPGASEALSATVSASSYSTVTQDAETTISNIIGGNGIRGSESRRWNLSNPSSPYSNSVAESANCYIVNACGYYRIPLVMGNGMVNNAINTNASTYKGATGTYSILFQDYTGSNITNPKLHRSSSGAGSPSSAFVVWEDVNGLIEAGSNYTLPNALEYDSSADLWWLNFHVDKARQGNAVIAVADASGTVMWSWHIWVTHDDQTNVTIMSDYDFANYNLMLMNLGWLPSGSGTVRIYSPRTVYVKIQQADGGQEAVMALTQAGKTVYTSFPTGGRGPYWQWGRKDAMWPSGTCYGRFGSVSTLTSRQTLAGVIKNPGKFIATGESSCWSSYSQPGNLWDSATKTIWDPCPAGYTVPSQAAITLVFNQWPDNVAVGTFNKGWHFYNSARTETVFFPAAGLRTATSGAVAEAGSTGNYWNDLMRTGDSGGSLWYFYDQWAFTAALSRSYGLSIRPKKR